MFCSGEITRLKNGYYSSVIVHQNQIYAAESASREIHVFDYTESALTKLRTIKLLFAHNKNKRDATLKMCATNNGLACSSSTHNEIQEYSFSGEFRQIYGRPGSGEAGQLAFPRICDVDTSGSVLITDCDNNRLQVMSEQGEFCVLDLEPEVSGPVSAAIFSGHLYVTSGNRTTIHKYSL